jgi:hypothetical protein
MDEEGEGRGREIGRKVSGSEGEDWQLAASRWVSKSGGGTKAKGKTRTPPP